MVIKDCQSDSVYLILQYNAVCSECGYMFIVFAGVCFIGDGALVAPSVQTLSLAETDITDVTLQLVASKSSAKVHTVTYMLHMLICSHMYYEMLVIQINL